MISRFLSRSLILLGLIGTPAQRAVAQDSAAARREYAVGRAQLERGRRLAADPLELGNRVGYGQFHSAISAFTRALENDPGFAAPALDLIALAGELNDTLLTRAVIETLRPTTGRERPDTGVLLGLGRLERSIGNGERAIPIFERFRAGGGSPTLADFELARTLLAMDRPAGESLYYAGAGSDDSGIVAGYREDLRPILDPGSLAEFDQARGADRVAWLRRFWLDRDHLELRSPGERLREHYRRLYYAEAHYALQVNRRFYTSGDLYRDLNARLDDRGVIYLRHGEPDERITTPIFGLNANESWVYRRPGEDLVLHFGAGGRGLEGGASDDYRLVSSILDLWRPGSPTDMLLLSRARISPLYEQMLNWGVYGRRHAADEEQRLVETSARTGISTDAYPIRYRGRLEPTVQLLATGGAELPLLHLVLSLPPDSAFADSVRIRLGVFDAQLVSVANLDTVIGLTGTSGGERLGHLALPFPAGTWRYRLAIEQNERGRLFPIDSVTIPDLARPALSDIVLAPRAQGIVWRPTDHDSVLLNASAIFPEGGTVEAYYEVSGLAPGTRYRTAITLFRREGRHGSRARQVRELSFEEISATPLDRIHRTLELKDLRAGDYWLEVSVATESGVRLRTRRPLGIAH
jgi:GWxTD domain-containing protein